MINNRLLKGASLPPDIKIQLDPLEEKICAFIKSALASMPNPPTVRIVGGWVRDKLLGKKSNDYDLTVEGLKGVDFANYLREFAEITYGPKQKIVGTIKDTEERPEQIKTLAVAFLRLFGQEVELLPVRGEEQYRPGDRNPIKVDMNADPESDARRRDLTINAMFYNINTGQLEDYTGEGYDDLLTMTLRTPLTKDYAHFSNDPEARQLSALRRISEDPLRALRVVRFYARYPNSRVAPELLHALKDPDIHRMITYRLRDPNVGYGIMPERTAKELRTLMKGPQPERGVQLMFDTGLLTSLLNLPSEFHPLTMDQRSHYHSLPVIQHIIQVIRNVNNLAKEFGLDDEQRMMLNFGALFHDLGKLDPRSHKVKPSGEYGYSGDPNNPNSIAHEESSTEIWENFARALRLSDNERLTVGSLVAGHMNPHDHVERGQVNDKTLRRYLRKNPDWMLQYIHAMGDAMSKTEEPSQDVAMPYHTNISRIRNLAPAMDSPPARDLLNGNRIIELVGLPAKPPRGLKSYIEIIKERIREAQDENPNLTVAEAEQIVLQMKANGEFREYQQ